MTVVKTDLRNTRESARRLRFEPAGAITQTNVQKAIEQMATTQQGVTGTPVNVSASPYTVLQTDMFLAVDTSGGAVSILLQSSAARLGIPLTIKDAGGNASVNNITITPNGAETIDGLSSLTISIPYGLQALVPKSSNGWYMTGSV